MNKVEQQLQQRYILMLAEELWHQQQKMEVQQNRSGNDLLNNPVPLKRYLTDNERMNDLLCREYKEKQRQPRPRIRTRRVAFRWRNPVKEVA